MDVAGASMRRCAVARGLRGEWTTPQIRPPNWREFTVQLPAAFAATAHIMGHGFRLHPVMKIFGIPARRPSFAEVTAASLMALGVWLGVVGLLYRLDQAPSAFDAGALLLVLAWGCIGVRMGIRPDRGSRHVLANFAVSALLLGLYAGAWGLVR